MKVYYTRCLIESHACLVAFDYGSDNIVDPKIGGETPVTSNLSPESSMDIVQYRATCERNVM